MKMLIAFVLGFLFSFVPDLMSMLVDLLQAKTNARITDCNSYIHLVMDDIEKSKEIDKPVVNTIGFFSGDDKEVDDI